MIDPFCATCAKGGLVRLAAVGAGLMLAGAAQGQAALAPDDPESVEGGGAAFELTVPNIMRGELLVGRSPDEVRWSADSRHVYFRWREPESSDTTTHIYRVGLDGADPERLSDSVALHHAPAERGTWSRDGRLRAFERNGDVFIADTAGTEWRITATRSRAHGPHVARDNRTIFYVSEGNLFAGSTVGGPVRQLTDLRTEDSPRERPAEGHEAALRATERELLAAVRDLAREREHREALDSIRAGIRPVYLGRGTSLNDAEVSPSGRYALLSVGASGEPQRTLVPNFVTESGYTVALDARPKVGDAALGQRAAIVDLVTHELTWVEPEPRDREQTLSTVGWAPDSDRALLIGTALDFKDRWIYVVAPDGAATVVDHLRDDAWIGGPGVFRAGWTPGGPAGPRGERVFFVSERSGFAHLYSVAPEGGRATALTQGRWEVTDVQLSRDGSSFHLTTSEEHPGVRHLYTMPVQGGPRSRITTQHGWNESVVAPDGRHVAVLHARGDRPPELGIMRLEADAANRRVTRSTTDEWRAGPWIWPEIVEIPAGDGARVPARIYRPRDLGAEPNGAAVVFVHGAGYLQNVHHGWSRYFREYMFHHLLASRGYTVLDTDFRASAGYGRDWRTAIYRHMGGTDLSDHVDAARWLVDHEAVDPARIGIYGGSYGGFITLMAMFTEPGVFRAGAALRAVTDWAHYNHPYTARILNRPQDDPEAYRRSSPIHFAEGLEGALLITHGMVDTNVHFQDVVRLAQRLIELGKTDWELAVYPVEDHAFQRPDSWADQYRRILELFERSIGTPVTEG